MTALRSELSALLAEAGVTDVDVDAAVADEHLRAAAYQRVVAVLAAGASRARDRAVVSVLVRDPVESVAKTAVVDLVDRIATTATDTAGFRRWWAEVEPAVARLGAPGNREFVRRRVQDWLCHLSIADGHLPSPAELAGLTNWMQRRLAAESTSLPVLTALAESGGTRKIRNVASHRARAVR